MLIQWILGILLILFALGVIMAKKPVHASLSFLATLLLLAGMYLELSSQFIAVMQILVYAGAILVIFMFVIVLFQDAHQQLAKFEPQNPLFPLILAAGAFLLCVLFIGRKLMGLPLAEKGQAEGYGSVESLGKLLYVDFFFPFEAIILLFLVAVVGALYIGRKVR